MISLEFKFEITINSNFAYLNQRIKMFNNEQLRLMKENSHPNQNDDGKVQLSSK